jgi:hypothetical protein
MSYLNLMILVSYMHMIGLTIFFAYDFVQRCSLAKIQHHSLSSINTVRQQHFAYDTMLRNLHCERPLLSGGGEITKEIDTG